MPRPAPERIAAVPLSPMLATPATAVPVGPDWVHEVKWDGMRVLVDIRGGQVRLTSRNGNDVTNAYPEVAPIGGLYADALLDAEIVAFDGGLPSFSALAERMHVRSARKAALLSATRPVTLMVFDLLRLFGADLTYQPWTARRELLERLDLAGAHWQVPPTYDDGAELHSATAEQGLEGVVAKRRSSVYTPGRRSPDWVKVAHRTVISAVVGGWRPETGNDRRLGAILVGVPEPGGLRYLGRFGSGLAGKAGAAMRAAIADMTIEQSPFLEVPREDASGATWVRPELVVDLRALTKATGGSLRHGSYVGLRPDLTAHDLLETGDG